MDPVEIAAQPATIEIIYAVMAAAGSLVVGIATTILAFLKLGVKSGNGKPGAEVKSLPVPEGWNELVKRVGDLSQNHAEHERMVSELHSALLNPEQEVQRRLMAAQLDRIEDEQKQIKSDISAISRGTTNNAEAVETMARKLKELSQ